LKKLPNKRRRKTGKVTITIDHIQFSLLKCLMLAIIYSEFNRGVIVGDHPQKNACFFTKKKESSQLPDSKEILYKRGLWKRERKKFVLFMYLSYPLSMNKL
jgi:hypothetical protein